MATTEQHRTEYRTVKIPVVFADKIDALISQGLYQSRAEYVKERIREDMSERVIADE